MVLSLQSAVSLLCNRTVYRGQKVGCSLLICDRIVYARSGLLTWCLWIEPEMKDNCIFIFIKLELKLSNFLNCKHQPRWYCSGNDLSPVPITDIFFSHSKLWISQLTFYAQCSFRAAVIRPAARSQGISNEAYILLYHKFVFLNFDNSFSMELVSFVVLFYFILFNAF